MYDNNINVYCLNVYILKTIAVLNENNLVNDENIGRALKKGLMCAEPNVKKNYRSAKKIIGAHYQNVHTLKSIAVLNE